MPGDVNAGVGKELDDEQKARLYNQVLQLYLTYYDQRKGQPLHVKISVISLSKFLRVCVTGGVKIC